MQDDAANPAEPNARHVKEVRWSDKVDIVDSDDNEKKNQSTDEQVSQSSDISPKNMCNDDNPFGITPTTILELEQEPVTILELDKKEPIDKEKNQVNHYVDDFPDYVNDTLPDGADQKTLNQRYKAIKEEFYTSRSL